MDPDFYIADTDLPSLKPDDACEECWDSQEYVPGENRGPDGDLPKLCDGCWVERRLNEGAVQ